MTELELLKVIGYAQDAHILDADEVAVRRERIWFSRPLVRTAAAILALVLALGLFLQTPMGAAAAEMVKAQVTRFLDILFPPKETVMYIEGIPETVHVEAHGREPEQDSPGFSIYVDTDFYTMTEENGAWFIRPIHVPENSGELPPVEMEIRELPELPPAQAAELVRAEMEGKWDNLSEIWGYGRPETLCIDASQDQGSNAPWEQHNFKSNSQGGSFEIILRGYREAYEGHGSRFYQMMQTFTLVAPQDPSQYTDAEDALVKAMQQEVVHAQEQDLLYEQAIQNAANQADMNIASYERNALWLDVHGKLWTALEQSLDTETFQNLLAEELEWATRKRIVQDQLQAEMGGGSLTGTVVSGESRKQVANRVQVLLCYLEGSASPVQRQSDVPASPAATAEAFADAWFRGDRQGVQAWLSEYYFGETELYSSGTEVLHAVKGLDNVIRDMANRGRLNASVEFRPTPDSDYYQYLSITLIWEQGSWAVESYGLEG